MKIRFLMMLLTVFFTVSSMFAAPVSQKQAEQAVQGWLNLDSKPLNEMMDVNISKVDSYQNNDKQILFYVVSLENGGYVIISADDLLEPIVAFSEEGVFDPSENNPLWSLINGDMSSRLDFIKNVKNPNQINNLNVVNTKWQQLLLASDKTEISKNGLSSISDVRVVPLVQSKWSQQTVNGLTTYNYYAPNNYPCGCVATAMAQLMRYHQYPTSGIGVQSHTIWVDGVSRTASTMGGNSSGGAYNWNSMPLVPTSSITTTQRQAIGALCYDAGVTVGMSYTSDFSGANTYVAASAFATSLGYQNARYAYAGSGIYITQLNLIISSNTDAANPILLGITGADGGHAIVCDGYGYNSSTRYSHLNMGWAGSQDMWYALPNIGAGYNFDTVYKAVYNVFPTKSGEIISGRVLDASGNPVSGVSVSAAGKTDTTDAHGIYGLVGVSVGSHTITASKSGYQTQTLTKTVTTSTNGGSCGNIADGNFTFGGGGSLTPPTNLSASDGTYSDHIYVSWSGVSGATHYRIARSTSSSGAGYILGAWYGGISFNDSSVTPGVTYYYWVQAASSSSGSGASGFCAYNSGYASSSGTLSKPSWISASDGNYSDGVHVSWAYVSGATHYRIARSTSSSGAGYILGNWYGGGRSIIDTSATPGIYYYYWVQAARSSSGSGAGPFSSSNGGYRSSGVLAKPSWVSASDGTSTDKIVLSWASVSGATHYRIARSTSSSGAGYILSNWYGGGRIINDSSVSAGIYYYYWVQAARSSSGSGAGAFSSYNRGYRARASSDPYEPSNTSVQFDLGPYNNRWLSQVRGKASIASTSDIDYYKVYFPIGRYNFTLLLDFAHSLGDLDLYLYDSDGSLLASSTSSSDDEAITGGVLIKRSSGYVYFGVKLYGSAPRYPVYYNLGYLATTARASSSEETTTGEADSFVSDVAPEENSK